MLEHHIQRTIIKSLSTVDSLSFSELKPDDLDNKLFDYHLKGLIRDQLVVKQSDGRYSLTESGKFMTVGAGRPKTPWEEKAYSIIFTIVKDSSNGKFLMAERLTHPLLGGIGLTHHHPLAGRTIRETARESLLKKTSLEADFTHIGSGYLCVYEGEELQTYLHYTLLYGESSGELQQNYDRSKFFWTDDILSELEKPGGLATAYRMVKQWQNNEGFVDEIILEAYLGRQS
jgi:hypothetical protein